LIADKGADEQISTATRILAKVIVKDAYSSDKLDLRQETLDCIGELRKAYPKRATGVDSDMLASLKREKTPHV
jgi:hypothetical protein